MAGPYRQNTAMVEFCHVGGSLTARALRDDARPMDAYEPASTIPSRRGLTLETFIFEGLVDRRGTSVAFTSLLTQLAMAAKLITSRVRRAGLAGVLGYTGETNVQGERVPRCAQAFGSESIGRGSLKVLR